ncbi:pentapeptide repeat-containing protein [Streptomyces xantholiticus]
MTQAGALTRARAGRPLRTALASEQQGGLDWARRIELASVLIASLVAVVGLWYSNVQNREANDQARQDRALSKEGQITDRYTAAVANLGDETQDVRLGGIYALQRIMEDSPRDHPTVANVLAAYIRIHAGKPRPVPAIGRRVPHDVDAALAVLADRDPNRDGKFALDLRNCYLPGAELRSTLEHRERIPLEKANLRASDLTRADLRYANLRDANLDNADLNFANLNYADLREATLARTKLGGAYLYRADLYNVHLPGAYLYKADLREANLRDANLDSADLRGADLHGASLYNADLHNADLRGADLRGADLSRAFQLEVEDLLVARLDSRTKLPPEMAKHPAVRTRIVIGEIR